MKKLLSLAIVMLLVVSCSDLEPLPESTEIKLGAAPTSTKILSAITTGTKVTVMYNLTVGAKYSVQVYGFGDKEPRKTLPLTAEEEITTRVYDFADLPNGLYDLTLTDVDGNVTKRPLIIKR